MLREMRFKIEGRLRQNFYIDGKYYDTLIMGILKEEWIKGE